MSEQKEWQDATCCVSSSCINLFTALEIEGALNPINEVDMFYAFHVLANS